MMREGDVAVILGVAGVAGWVQSLYAILRIFEIGFRGVSQLP
jgi:hypothetical protein